MPRIRIKMALADGLNVEQGVLDLEIRLFQDSNDFGLIDIFLG
jgi:hypothetical protein